MSASPEPDVVAGQLVLPHAVVPGWLRVRDGVLAEVRTGPPPAGATRVDGYVLPGLVDVHCHGGGGHCVDQGAGAARRALAVHRAAGTTTTVASLLSAPAAQLLAQVGDLAPLVAAGDLAGLHLEGPYLSPARRGAHPAAALRDPDVVELRRLLDAGGGAIRMVTLAPELPGALELLDVLVARGVVAALGHTDADAATCRAAVQRGATMATHLWNAMRPLHHRDGGPVAALAGPGGVICELVADGHHVAADVLALSWQLLGPDRAVLVTDASAPAGCPDGTYTLGGAPVHLRAGAVRTDDGTSLAGSALTLIEAVRAVVALGVAVPDAVRSASATPARALGLAGVGELTPGYRADVLVTDASLRPVRVMRSGRWL